MRRSIEEIRQINRRRKKLREDANRQVFQICMERIKQFAYRGMQSMEYEIPIVFGTNPYYDRDSCFDYITGRLSESFALQHRGYVLLIDWSELL